MNRARRFVVPMLLLLAVVVFGSSSSLFSPQASAQAPARVYLPQTIGNVIPRTIFGIDISQATPERNLNGARNIGSSFVRRGNLPWNEVQPTETGGYNWATPRIALLEAELRNISALGMETIMVVRGSPRWAAPSDCQPINPAKYGAFAAFLSEAVKRYSQPPYNVRYWEIFNEPDTPIGPDSGFGCWGVTGDPYYGGGAFGNMLKAVYPSIKAANAQVQVVNGSLLLDKPNTPPAKFLEGMLRAGAAPYFDVMGYHSYCYYQNANNPDGVDARNQPCTSDWKVPFIRNVFSTLGVAPKPLFNTEVALQCAGGADCRQVQADWIGRNFARSMRDGLSANVWYLFDADGFRSTALVEPGNPFVPRPAYGAFKQASLMLGESQYLGDLSKTGQPAGVEGHRFGRNGEVTTIVWSNTPRTARIPIAAGVVPTCLGRDGQVITCAAAGGAVSLPVGRSPVYVIGR